MFSELSNEQMGELTSKFNKLHGAKFINVNGYTAKSGEVSNHTINVNVDIEAAKKSDLETLKNYPTVKLDKLAESFEVDYDVASKALEELITSAEKNLTNDTQTVQSKAQSDAYTSLGKGLRIHNENLNIYITGFANSKNVIVEGEYKVVKSRPKTLIKKAIQKGLKMSKFRNFKLGEAQVLSISGSTIKLNS